MRISKDVLVDGPSKALLEHPFDLSPTDSRWDIYYRYFPLYDVQQFQWLAEQCAEDLAGKDYFDEDSFFVENIPFLRICFQALPVGFKAAFKELGDAIRKTAGRVGRLFPS